MPKEDLYKTFINRMKSASDAGAYLEASWYAYAALEDRLVSLLQNSGGVGENAGGANGKPIKMMGRKIKELNRRAEKDKLLKENFEHDKLNAWKDSRNNLMHAMGDATMTIDEIDASAKKLAEDGQELVREYAAACRRLKKHRDKVAV
ncbi:MULTISPECIES: hypothetical protein [Stenotrophomonas]|uniref:Uncharacterized protein n=2 Tax=Stenotrophomonas TaxID=40323 RepID=A0AAP5C7G2_9GAMM|nr:MULTISPECIES: hypothetical protein [Stenotrophomonas]MDP4310848.1 hypothetical protein [Stenotrophomonas geniculata]MDQ7954228.1 hypothetical protein [Stenotrophomonas geniculata]UXB29921.1 hypothetical protein K7568_09010 [Stenotrophomonas maltophilia]WDM65573.1 hypothetical protein K5L94_09970 [Stenotrophomonas sp. DFS-20110405]